MSTPDQRALQARIAAHSLHAQHDARETTAKARQVFLSRFERAVDPNCELPAHERARRAEHQKRAYFQQLALKSAQARSGK